MILVWDPIEVRYQLNWYASKVNQAQYKHDQMVDGYETQLDYYRQRAEYDKRCTHNCMDYLYMSIDTLKSLLNDFQKKYDNDYEKIENRVAYQRIQIDKLREQRRFLTEAIQRFHEETEQMRIYEEELQAKRDLQRQVSDPSIIHIYFVLVVVFSLFYFIPIIEGNEFI